MALCFKLFQLTVPVQLGSFAVHTESPTFPLDKHLPLLKLRHTSPVKIALLPFFKRMVVDKGRPYLLPLGFVAVRLIFMTIRNSFYPEPG